MCVNIESQNGTMYRFLLLIRSWVRKKKNKEKKEKIRSKGKNVKVDVKASKNTQLISFINLISCAFEFL